MRKTYIRPESRLFVINLAEKIADGSVGSDEIVHAGGVVSEIVNGTRVYTGVEGAKVFEAYQDGQFLDEIMKYAIITGNFKLLDCVHDG